MEEERPQGTGSWIGDTEMMAKQWRGMGGGGHRDGSSEWSQGIERSGIEGSGIEERCRKVAFCRI